MSVNLIRQISEYTVCKVLNVPSWPCLKYSTLNVRAKPQGTLLFFEKFGEYAYCRY